MRGAHRGMFGRGMEGHQGNNRQEARAVARISQSMAHRASTQSCAFQPYIQETRYLTTCNQASFIGHYCYCCSRPETVTKL